MKRSRTVSELSFDRNDGDGTIFSILTMMVSILALAIRLLSLKSHADWSGNSAIHKLYLQVLLGKLRRYYRNLDLVAQGARPALCCNQTFD